MKPLSQRHCPKGIYTVQMVGAQYNVTRKFVIE